MKDINELTQKELRRLSRKDLLTLMLDQARQIEALEQKLEDEKARRIRELLERDHIYEEKLATQKQLTDMKIKLFNKKPENTAERKSKPATLVSPRWEALRQAIQSRHNMLINKQEKKF